VPPNSLPWMFKAGSAWTDLRTLKGDSGDATVAMHRMQEYFEFLLRDERRANS